MFFRRCAGRPLALVALYQTRLRNAALASHYAPHHVSPSRPCDSSLDLHPIFLRNSTTDLCSRYGAEARDFAEIARVSHEHSSRNPYAQFNTVYSLEDIEKSPMIHYPLTKLQCSPTSDGAGAAIVSDLSFLPSFLPFFLRQDTRASFAQASRFLKSLSLGDKLLTLPS